MARLILLDSGPLGLIVRAPRKPQVVRCITWLKAIAATGAIVIIPEIAHFAELCIAREFFLRFFDHYTNVARIDRVVITVRIPDRPRAARLRPPTALRRAQSESCRSPACTARGS